MVEKERKAARRAERTTELIEVAAHVGNRTGIVVGSRFHHNSDTERTVSFVYDFLVVACILVGSLLDGAFNGVLRHIGCFCVLQEHTQAGVAGRVRASGFHRDSDFLTDFCERTRHVAPTFQFSRFAIFKSSSHEYTFYYCSYCFDLLS